MNFLVDHDVPSEIGHIIVGSGHTVATVSQALSETASDEEVFDAATRANQLLITCNRDDFLALAKERQHSGLIILIRRRTRVAEGAALLRLLDRAGLAGLSGNINFA